MALNKFHFWCQKVLPLVYDDSLSYYEVLCKLTNNLNTVIETVDELVENYGKYDDAIAALQSGQATLEANFTTLKTSVDSSISEIREYVNTSVDDITTKVNNINATITLLQAADATLQNEIDALDKNMQGQIDVINRTIILNYADLDSKINDLSKTIQDGSVLAELRTMVKELQEKMNNLTYDIYNYVLDKRVSFDYNNYTLYEHLGNALTAEQYCELGLTADEYAKYDIMALNYVKFSRDLLNYDWVHVPIVGGKQAHSIALDLLANYMYQTMTADDYKQLNLDADDYAELGLTSIHYLYYPISDTIALSPFQYMVNLSGRIDDNVTADGKRDEEIESIKTNLTGQGTEIENLTNNFNNVNTRTETLETNYASMYKTMSTLEVSGSDMQASIEDLQNRITALENA